MEPAVSAKLAADLQDYLRHNTRLGIPALIVAEALHGVMTPEATVFPQAIGLASSWDTDLVGEIAAAIGAEAAAIGIDQVLAPVLDLARDPRWGRVEETYGEDPCLAAAMGTAYVRGAQGMGPPIPEGRVVATIKHFAAHGSPEGGINLSPVPTGERLLRELYLPSFQAAIKAGALSAMPAYSELDGIPCHASEALLTDILRSECGFTGYTIADYGAVEMLASFHRTAENRESAAFQALQAGLDMEAPVVWAYGDALLNMVKDGRIQESLLDLAVTRILSVKLLTGLMDGRKASPLAAFHCEKHQKLALQAARESVILLKNEGGILPLGEDIDRIALIGPNGNVAQLGDYCLERPAPTLLDGLRDRLGARTQVIFEEGCSLTGLDRTGFAKAVSAAQAAQVAILALGGCSMIDYGIGWGQDKSHVKTCGEGFDTHDLSLPGVQGDLACAVMKTGTPVVLVHLDGRPAAIPQIYQNATAVLEAWYPGEQGGYALADLLVGLANPCGKLPVSIPKHVGQLPVCYNHKPSSRGFYHKPGSPEEPGRDYICLDTLPAYAFGYGLSYTGFAYSDLSVTPQAYASGEQALVRVQVKNTGARTGKEVVQLYVRDLVSSVTTPVKALKAFRKIELRPGEEQAVCFMLRDEDLALYDRNLRFIVEPGEFEVMIGGLSANFRSEGSALR